MTVPSTRSRRLSTQNTLKFRMVNSRESTRSFVRASIFSFFESVRKLMLLKRSTRASHARNSTERLLLKSRHSKKQRRNWRTRCKSGSELAVARELRWGRSRLRQEVVHRRFKARANCSCLTLRRVCADLDDLLAEVLALKQPDQFARGVHQPVRDVLPVLDPALHQPATHVA